MKIVKSKGVLILFFVVILFGISNSECMGQKKIEDMRLFEFQSFVDSVYSTMYFNDTYLNLNKVEIRQVPAGFAFAYFHPDSKKRYILLNYKYVHSKLTAVQANDSIRTDILKLILAHEWAHHFMGHIFNLPNSFNERNADILAGRILNQLGIQIEVIDYVKELLVGMEDRQHLGATARSFLLWKGYTAEEIIKLSDSKIEELSNELFCKYLKPQLQLRRKELILQINDTIQYQMQDLLCKIELSSYRKEGLRLDFNLGEIFQNVDTSCKSGRKLRYSEKFSSFIKKQPLKPKTKGEVTNGTYTEDVLCSLSEKKKELNKYLDGFFEIQITEIEKSFKNANNSILQTVNYFNNNEVDPKLDTLKGVLELMYTKYYIENTAFDNKYKVSKKSNTLSADFKKGLYEFGGYDQENRESASSLRCKLKGVDGDISYVKHSAELEINGRTYPPDFLNNKRQTIDKTGFLHFYDTPLGVFFIDECFHLWTEIVASVKLRNKIFLERLRP